MFEDLNAYQFSFWFCAILGTAFFLINTLLSMISGVDTDLDVSSHTVSHEGISSPDSAFQLISLTSLTGFVMMFGWVGLACYEQLQLGTPAAFAVAFFAGLMTMYATAYIFKSAKKLISSGSVFDINLAIGKRATVYARIPREGKGQIQLAMADVTHELDALSEDGSEIDSNKNVEVVRVMDKSTVVVKIVQ